jgi:hypothetical protein
MAAFATIAVLATPARADAIDGEWCLANNRFRIDGPTIVTPGGNRVQGSYTRHSFSYIVPVGETGAGTMVAMLLLNEEHVEVRNGTAHPVVWRRCQVTS